MTLNTIADDVGGDAVARDHDHLARERLAVALATSAVVVQALRLQDEIPAMSRANFFVSRKVRI